AVIDRSDLFTETILGHHISGYFRSPHYIVAGSGAYIIEGEGFGHTSAQKMDDGVPHAASCLIISVFFRQSHGEAAGSSPRNYRNLMNRIAVRYAPCHNRVSRLV